MQKLVELVNLWAKYEEENPGSEIRDFCVAYLTEQEAQAPAVRGTAGGLPSDLNARLGKGIGRLTRFSALYAKKALQDLPLNNIEELIYLAHIQYMGQPKKSELIYEMLSEFPSGIDIIKRLAAMALVDEFPDAHDKRSKRLRITPEGQTVLAQCMPRLAQIGAMAFQPLRHLEKLMLAQLLEKLDDFHAAHYKSARNTDFEAVYRMVME